MTKTETNSQPSSRPQARRLRGPGSALALFGALAGILIWSKLRVVTEMPRSAYADPKDAQYDAPAGGSDDASEPSPTSENSAISDMRDPADEG